MNQPIDFYDRRVAEKLPTTDNPENEAVIQHAMAALDLRPGEVLVDFGCGDGYFLTTLAQRVDGLKCYGFDIVRYPAWSSIPDVHFTSLESLPIPLADSSVDKVFCSQVIEHVSDAQALAAELARILKPNGRLWIATPNSYSKMHPLFHSLQRRIDLIEGHVRHFSADDFMSMFQPYGCEVMHVRYDLFLALWIYYSISYYLPAFKRTLVQTAVPAIKGESAPPRLTGRLLKSAVFFVLRAARLFDNLFAHSTKCQVIEVTIHKLPQG